MKPTSFRLSSRGALLAMISAFTQVNTMDPGRILIIGAEEAASAALRGLHDDARLAAFAQHVGDAVAGRGEAGAQFQLHVGGVWLRRGQLRGPANTG